MKAFLRNAAQALETPGALASILRADARRPTLPPVFCILFPIRQAIAADVDERAAGLSALPAVPVRYPTASPAIQAAEIIVSDGRQRNSWPR